MLMVSCLGIDEGEDIRKSFAFTLNAFDIFVVLISGDILRLRWQRFVIWNEVTGIFSY
jgi:hypothetical protein